MVDYRVDGKRRRYTVGSKAMALQAIGEIIKKIEKKKSKNILDTLWAP